MIHNIANPSPGQVEEELKTEFPEAFNTNPGFLKACVAIGGFLSDPNKLRAGLRGLENELDRKVDARREIIIKHYQARAKGGSSTLEEDLQHLLSQYLSQLEHQLGFTLYSTPGYKEPKVQTYVKFIQPDTFRKQISEGLHWKDPGVPFFHGEYTHRMQWCLIARELKSEVEAPVKVFKEIGGVTYKDGKLGLWDALFDRDGGEAANNPFKVDVNTYDGRSPERFTHCIVDESAEKEIPILHWFVKSRLEKRKGFNNVGTVIAYVNKKLVKYKVIDKPENAEAAMREAVGGTFRGKFKDDDKGILRPGQKTR